MRRIFGFALLCVVVCVLFTTLIDHTIVYSQVPTWDSTPTPQIVEFRRLMRVPREELADCGEIPNLYDAVLDFQEYDRSFTNDDPLIVCVRGGRDTIWQEVAGYYTAEVGFQVQVQDLVWVAEFYWYELRVLDKYLYYPSSTYASFELWARLSQCDREQREYGDWYICQTDHQIEPEALRIPLPQ